MSPIWKDFGRPGERKFIWVCLSATNEEIELSNVTGTKKIFKVKPGQDYRGASYYLTNNQCFEAEPFYDRNSKKLSSQAEDILNSFNLLFGSIFAFAKNSFKGFETWEALILSLPSNKAL